jgi:hypothetical protein
LTTLTSSHDGVIVLPTSVQNWRGVRLSRPEVEAVCSVLRGGRPSSYAENMQKICIVVRAIRAGTQVAVMPRVWDLEMCTLTSYLLQVSVRKVGSRHPYNVLHKE